MNSTDVVGWAPEPQARGTVGLIWSCLATIFLCTWNAVHPNLPGMNDNAWRIFGRRVVFMLIALVAPEFICAAASEELRSAWAVQAQVSDSSVVLLTSANLLAVARLVSDTILLSEHGRFPDQSGWKPGVVRPI